MTGLAGKGILVTRPREQAEPLIERLQAAGAHPVPFPAIEIAPPQDPARLRQGMNRLPELDWLIFISPTAVARFFAEFGERTLPASIHIAAIGEGSARALRQRGVGEIVFPEGNADSESLLALPAMQAVRGQKIMIVRGEGGREVLAETLRARGAEVEYAECYRRRRPAADAAPLLAEFRRGAIDAITASSGEGVDNLFALLGEAGAGFLRDTPWFVPHARIAETARRLGVRQVAVSAAGDDALLTTLEEWFAHG